MLLKESNDVRDMVAKELSACKNLKVSVSVSAIVVSVPEIPI